MGKAAVYTGHKKPFEIREYPVTEPAPGYARLKIIASGVCGTDVHIHDGILGGDNEQIIGHEFLIGERVPTAEEVAADKVAAKEEAEAKAEAEKIAKEKADKAEKLAQRLAALNGEEYVPSTPVVEEEEVVEEGYAYTK